MADLNAPVPGQPRREFEANAELLKHSDDPIIVWTLSDGIESWSEGAAELYGYTEEEALSRAPAELLRTRFPVPWDEIIGALRTRGSWEGELVKQGKDGRKAVLWSRLRMVVDPDGTERVLEVSRDVTSRKRMEDALRAAEARFRTAAEAIPALLFEADAQGRNTYVNRTFAAFTGLPKQALLGEGWIDFLHPDDRDSVCHVWRKAVRIISPYEQEYRLRSANGEWRWFLTRCNAVRDVSGAVEKWICVSSDIDAAKQADAALREREEQFRTLAESLPQLTWMADAKGWIYWYNRRWFEYTGTTLEEMQGWGWRKVHHPDHVERVVGRIQHSWDSGEPWEDTFPLRGVNGEYRWFLSRAEPLCDAEGRVARWFGTNTDITEQRRLEELQRLMMSEISHRVKNSLTLVSSLLLLQARTVEDSARVALEDASSRVRAVATVHDQLWRQADAQAVNLSSFLPSLTGAIAATAPKHKTIVEVEPAMVSADKAVSIGLLVNELVSNAYKYAYLEGDEGEVRVSGRLIEEGLYHLEVSDHGVGLPESSP